MKLARLDCLAVLTIFHHKMNVMDDSSEPDSAMHPSARRQFFMNRLCLPGRPYRARRVIAALDG